MIDAVLQFEQRFCTSCIYTTHDGDPQTNRHNESSLFLLTIETTDSQNKRRTQPLSRRRAFRLPERQIAKRQSASLGQLHIISKVLLWFQFISSMSKT